MAEAVVTDRKRLIPASALLTGEYGIDDVYIGVPVILGSGGVERIIELDLTEEESAKLMGSATVLSLTIDHDAGILTCQDPIIVRTVRR